MVQKIRTQSKALKAPATREKTPVEKKLRKKRREKGELKNFKDLVKGRKNGSKSKNK